MAEKISPELQAQLGKLKDIQERLNLILVDKSRIESELKEINKVLEELSLLSQDSELFKIVGNIMVKTDKTSIEKELNDKKELLELRQKTYQKQESLLRKQYEELQSKVSSALSKYYQQGGSGGTMKA
ncbi:prefoldin subunit beta [Sulfolobales archaeon HS-7]|nr:prefoldin subunit beta [Sulfolobales archaeon HS-7]